MMSAHDHENTIQRSNSNNVYAKLQLACKHQPASVVLATLPLIISATQLAIINYVVSYHNYLWVVIVCCVVCLHGICNSVIGQ